MLTFDGKLSSFIIVSEPISLLVDNLILVRQLIKYLALPRY